MLHSTFYFLIPKGVNEGIQQRGDHCVEDRYQLVSGEAGVWLSANEDNMVQKRGQPP